MLENNDNELIKVRSLELLKRLNDAKCMGLLNKVAYSRIEGRPIYFFVPKDDVNKVVDDFIKEYGVDDRSSDSDLWWKYYSPSGHMFCESRSTNKVTTRKYSVITEIFNIGCMCNLVEVFADKNGKRGFVFLHNDEIQEIKERIDERDAKRYYEKMNKLEDNRIDGE